MSSLTDVPETNPAIFAGVNTRVACLLRAVLAKERKIVGLISGTSMDGLDIALCAIRGAGPQTVLRLLHYETQPWPPTARRLMRILAAREQVPWRRLAALHARLGAWQADMLRRCLIRWREPLSGIHCLAAHGQTMHHAPYSWRDHNGVRHASLQLGDGDHLAQGTGILTLSDFRQKELACGGQGAPLAPYAEALLFAADTPRILLNLGGIANYTWLPPRGSQEAPQAGDSGPANCLIDEAVRICFPQHPYDFDHHGTLAAQGQVHAVWLRTLLTHPYFSQQGAQSTGTETFGRAFLQAQLPQAHSLGLSGEDILATLTHLSVESVAKALRSRLGRTLQGELHVSGGGSHNATLCRGLREALPELRWCAANALGVPADAKEAVLFAVLANETLCGKGFVPLVQGERTAYPGEAAHIGLGKLSFPC